MLSYKLIKRKYKITDTNIADFFSYSSRISFLTSTLTDMVFRQVEITHDRYEQEGVKGAVKYVESVEWPDTVKPERKRQYRAGLLEFIDVVNHQTRKGQFRDPLNRPSRKKTYKPVKTKRP